MTGTRRTPGGLALVGALIAVGAALTAFAATRIWWTATFADTPVGRYVSTASGSDTVPELVAVALVALAGFGAALATRGGWRRAVGGLITAVGLLVAGRALVGLANPPREVLGRTPFVVGVAVTPTAHPVPAVAAAIGGLLIAAAGVLLLLGAGAGRRMGGRYERKPAAPGTAPARDPDPADAAADLWKALDAGGDPTILDHGTADDQPPDEQPPDDDTIDAQRADGNAADDDDASEGRPPTPSDLPPPAR